MSDVEGNGYTLLPIDNGPPEATARDFASLMLLWFAGTICGGIAPGQSLFAELFADAGLLSSICATKNGTSSTNDVVVSTVGSTSGLHPSCDEQYLAITYILNNLMGMVFLFWFPCGIVFDAIGARKTGVYGALLMVIGIFIVILSLNEFIPQMPGFVVGIWLNDFGDLMQAMGFYGLLFQLPGWQALIIGMQAGANQTAALLPVALRTLMLFADISFASALIVYMLALCFAAYLTYAVLPSQKEYMTRAEQVLGVPLPEKKVPKMSEVREYLKKSVLGAHKVLQRDKYVHYFVLAMLTVPFITLYAYMTMAVPFGELIFGTHKAGVELASLYAKVTGVTGAILVPIMGVCVDKVGLAVLLIGMTLCIVVIQVVAWNDDWTSQTFGCVATALYVNTTTLFFTKHLLSFAPPHRFGTTAGVWMIGYMMTMMVMFTLGLGGLSGLLNGGTVSRKPTESELNLMHVIFRGFGFTGIGLLVLWTARIIWGKPLTLNLLPEDEEEILAQYQLKSFESAAEKLKVTKPELMRMLASDDVLVQRRVAQAAIELAMEDSNNSSMVKQ